MDGKNMLEEGFDPSSLKVAELRKILNENGVSVSSGSKKADLIELFQTNIGSGKGLSSSGGKEKSEKIKVKKTKSDSVDGSRGGTSEAEELKKKKKKKTKKSEDSERTTSKITKKSKDGAKDKKVTKVKDASVLETLPVPKISPKPKKSNDSDNESSAENSVVRSTSKSPKSADKPFRKRPLSASESPSVKKAKKQTKSIFDDSDDSLEDLEVLTPAKRDHKVKESPKVVRPPNAKSPKSLRSPKSSKPVPEVISPLIKSEELGKQSTPKPVNTPVLPSSNKDSSFIDNLLKVESEELEEFDNMEDEVNDFDANLRRIKGEPEVMQPQLESEPEAAPSLIRSPLRKLDTVQLGSQLGVTMMTSFGTTQMAPPVGFEEPEPEPEELEVEEEDTFVSSEFNSAGVESLIPKVAIIKRETQVPEIEKSESPEPSRFEDAEKEEDEDDKLDSEEENEKQEEEDITEEANKSIDVFDKVEAEMIEEIHHIRPTNLKSVRSFSVLQTLFYLGLWVIMMSSALFGYWYREQMFLVGYCGYEIDQRTVSDDTYPWLQAVGDYFDAHYKPECVSCPAHARCFNLLELGCYEDFIQHSPWYDFLIPTERKCIPDTKKAEKLELMIDMALDLLRSKNADNNCGKTSADEFEAGISVKELHDILLSIKAPYITTEEFDDLWNRSLIELEKEPEIISGYSFGEVPTPEKAQSFDQGQENHHQKVLRSTSLQNISLACQLQNTLVMAILENKHIIFLVMFFILLYKITEWQYYKNKRHQLQLEIIYKEVMNKLQRQKKVSELNHSIPGYIGSIQLRDLILSEESNLSRKLKLWKKVSKKVEMNTNVKSTLLESHGEIMLVWEWITNL